jgi:hypothetical protein
MSSFTQGFSYFSFFSFTTIALFFGVFFFVQITSLNIFFVNSNPFPLLKIDVATSFFAPSSDSLPFHVVGKG